MQEDHRAIAEHAHRLWEARGRPTGADEEIWLEAERLFRNEQTSTEQSAKPATPAHESSLALDNSLRDSFPASDPPASNLPDEPAANLDEKWRAAGIKRTDVAASGATSSTPKNPPRKKNKPADPPPGLISIDDSIDEVAGKALEEAKRREQAQKAREQAGKKIDPAK